MGSIFSKYYKTRSVEDYDVSQFEVDNVVSKFELSKEDAKWVLQLRAKRDDIRDKMGNDDNTNPALTRGYQEAMYKYEEAIESLAPGFLGLSRYGKEPSSWTVVNMLFVQTPHKVTSDVTLLPPSKRNGEKTETV